jgi:hypothetical protein
MENTHIGSHQSDSMSHDNVTGGDDNQMSNFESEQQQQVQSPSKHDKRTRTNYGHSAQKIKIEEAVKELLDALASGRKVNVRSVSEARRIPYNTLRDHYKKSQGLMAPPRRTSFNYPLAEYKGPTVYQQRLRTVIAPENAKPFVYDIRKRGRKPALPKLIESQLKTFVVKMNAVGLAVDRTQLKQVCLPCIHLHYLPLLFCERNFAFRLMLSPSYYESSRSHSRSQWTSTSPTSRPPTCGWRRSRPDMASFWCTVVG